MTHPVETELKLAVPARARARVGRHPLLAAAAPRTHRLRSVYFDTPEFTLLRAGVGLRIRHDGRQRLQTLKADGKTTLGLHRHTEIETPVAGDTPRLDALDHPGLSDLFTDEVRERLAPIFETDIRRTTWELHDGTGGCAEVALDAGEIRAGGERLPISELEIELKAGSPEWLFAVALQLHAVVPLSLEDRSKAARGYGLLGAPAPEARKLKTPALQGGAPAADAARAVIAPLAQGMRVNALRFLETDDPEALHGLRVAVRRLRAVLSVFKPVLPATALAEWQEELRDLGGALGPARDWDVFVTQTLPATQAGLNAPEVGELAGAAAEKRAAAREAARARLREPAYTRLLLRLQAWLLVDDAPASALTARELAAKVLAKRHRRLLRQGSGVATLTEDERHRVRIAAKKARYAAEAFRPLFSGKAQKRYLAHLAGLQEVLGGLNDAAVARRLGAELGLPGPGAWLLHGFQAGRAQGEGAGLARRWDEFRKSKPYWR